MVKNIDIMELEDVIINAITPSYIMFDMLLNGNNVDSSLIVKAKNRLFDIRKYIEGLKT